jgi:Protein of unknown function (DUF4231)
MQHAGMFARCEDLITYYGRKANTARIIFLSLKSSQILLAASIPVVALISPATSQPTFNGVLGALIVVVEGLQQAFQFQRYWIKYRTAQRTLVNEHHLYLAEAGPYRVGGTDERNKAFAERVETVAMTEHGSWVELTEAVVSKAVAAKAD